MANEALAEIPSAAELPPGARQIQRVEALPPEYTYLLYPVPCHGCGVASRVGLASSYLNLKHAERSLLILESGLIFSYACPTCRLTTDAICTMLTSLGHDHWEHARAVGVVASHTLKVYEEGTPATCLHHATLTLRCGLCTWGEIRTVTERTTLRYRVHALDEVDPVDSIGCDGSPRPARRRVRRATREPAEVTIPTPA